MSSAALQSLHRSNEASEACQASKMYLAAHSRCQQDGVRFHTTLLRRWSCRLACTEVPRNPLPKKKKKQQLATPNELSQRIVHKIPTGQVFGCKLVAKRWTSRDQDISNTTSLGRRRRSRTGPRRSVVPRPRNVTPHKHVFPSETDEIVCPDGRGSGEAFRRRYKSSKGAVPEGTTAWPMAGCVMPAPSTRLRTRTHQTSAASTQVSGACTDAQMAWL